MLELQTADLPLGKYVSSPDASTVDSGTPSNSRLVIPRKFAARAIPLAEAADSKMRLGEVPIAAMICSGEGSGGFVVGVDCCCFSIEGASPSTVDSDSSTLFSNDCMRKNEDRGWKQASGFRVAPAFDERNA